MFNKKPIIKYECTLKEFPNGFVTSKSKIPDWYKKISPPNKDLINVKLCLPFLDAMTSGYMILLAYDLDIKDVDGKPFIKWKGIDESIQPIKWREDASTSNKNLVPEGFYDCEYLWNTFTAFKVSKGYNLLVTHPFNRSDLPFMTLTGVVEGDFTFSALGNLPFYVKKGFTGVIPQGTPIAQILPFKNEDWVSKKTPGLGEEGENNRKTSSLVFSGWYKNNIWKRKNYN